jgi:hypothetical protein
MRTYHHNGTVGYIRPQYDADDRTLMLYVNSDLHTVLRDPASDDGNYDLVAREGAVPVAVEQAVSLPGHDDYENYRLRMAIYLRRSADKMNRNAIWGSMGNAAGYRPTDIQYSDRLVGWRSTPLTEDDPGLPHLVSITEDRSWPVQDQSCYIIRYRQPGNAYTEYTLGTGELSKSVIKDLHTFGRNRTLLYVKPDYVEGWGGYGIAAWNDVQVITVPPHLGAPTKYALIVNKVEGPGERPVDSLTLAVSADIRRISEWYFDIKQSFLKMSLFGAPVHIGYTDGTYYVVVDGAMRISGLETVDAAISATMSLEPPDIE